MQLRKDGEFLTLYISFSVGKPFCIKWKATPDNVARAKFTYDMIRKAIEKGSPYAEVIDDEAEYNRENE